MDKLYEIVTGSKTKTDILKGRLFLMASDHIILVAQ
jgi:hypothetical protein